MDNRLSVLRPRPASQEWSVDSTLLYNNHFILPDSTTSTTELFTQLKTSPDFYAYSEIVISYLELNDTHFFAIDAIRHCTALRQYHPSLFDKPPPGLFNIILQLRLSIKDDERQRDRIVDSLRQHAANVPLELVHGSKTAPDGQEYVCPSRNCSRGFQKWGHCRNHIEKQHPEYHDNNPGYRPEHFLEPRRMSRSPEVDRRRRRRSLHASRAQQETRRSRHSPDRSEHLEPLSPLTPRSNGQSSTSNEIEVYNESAPVSRHSSQRSPGHLPHTPQSNDRSSGSNFVSMMPEASSMTGLGMRHSSSSFPGHVQHSQFDDLMLGVQGFEHDDSRSWL